MREMYVTFIRMVLAFEILPAMDPEERPVLTGPLEATANPTGLSVEPGKSRVGLRVRDRAVLEGWWRESEAATVGVER